MKDRELHEQLATAERTIRVLQDELAESNRGLIALSMELETRVEERTAELAQANEALRAEIADRKRIEEEREGLLAERKQQSKFLESLIDNAPIGVAVVDRGMRYVLANPAYRSIAGTPDTPVVGRTVAEVFPPEVARIVEPFVQRVFESGEMLQIPGYEAPVRGRTWWNISEIPLRDAAGNVEAVLILTEEVTDRKQAAETLRQSEQRFRSFVEATTQVVWTTNPHGEVDMTIPAWQAYTGQSADEARGFGWMNAIRAEDRSRVADAWRRAFETGGLYEVEYLLRIHDGSWRNILARGVPVRASDGQIREYMGVCIDITARKQVEAALRESEQRFRTMADAIPQLAWIAKADGWIFWYNRRWYEYTGTTPEQMEGWGWQSVHDPQTLSTVLERWKVSIATGKPFDMTFPLRGVDGVFRPFLTRIMPLRDEQGRVVQWFGTNTDISEQKATEKELATAKASAERAKAAAEQANRAKDHFLAVLSHELRTPLTPVVMGVSILQDRSDLAPAARETLEMIGRNIEMEARLIDDLLDVSRIARGKIELQKQRVELCTVIQRAVEVCKPDIEARRLHFGVDVGPAAPYWIEADVSRLQQVFWNLLKNAIKFTPPDGCVGIRCRPNEKYIVVEVNDSGIGIEPEALSRIFNAFEQAEQSITRQFGGLGLGLAISKALVELHGGLIEAYSEGRGKGATFRVRLPLTTPPGQPEVRVADTPQKRAVRPLHILLVEDHGVTAKLMRMILTLGGHTVESAGDVATALELASQHAFDLLVSDLGLPDGSGHDLIRQLRQRGHKFPGIALSGYGQTDDIQRSREAGFAAHLTKPASREAVVEAIASATAGEFGDTGRT